MGCDGHVVGSFWHVCTCPAGRAVLAGARCPAQLTCFCRVAQLFHVRCGRRRERGWKCAVVCPRGQGCLARGSADWCRRCWSVRADRATSALRADQALLIARAVSKRASIKPWRAMQVKILPVRLASLAASSILHGGLMWSSLRPRVMCGIRDSSHTHIHTNTYTPTSTPVARSCVCGDELSLSLEISLYLSLSGCAGVCLRGR